MRNRLLLIIILFSVVSFVSAQQRLFLNGVVLSARDSTPISYAHSGIPGQGIGVVTNEMGAFRLNFPVEFLADTLQVSHMGFESYAALLRDLQGIDTLKIYLSPDVYHLGEVIVTPNPDSAEIILREALSRLNKNYPTNQYQLNAFYREKTQNREDYRYTRLIEAMLDIRDWGITSDPGRIRIRLNEFRKSNDLAKYTLGQRIWRRFFGEDNQLYDILLQDPIRIHLHNSIEGAAYTISRYWLKEILQRPESAIWMVDITSFDGQKVYHMNFNYPNCEGSIFINALDLGIFKIEIMNTAGIPSKPEIEAFQILKDDLFYEKAYGGKVTVNYKKINGIYYLSYIERVELGNVRKSNLRRGEKTWSYNTSMLMVNSVQRNKKEMDKVKRRQRLDRDQDMGDVEMEYNKDFWQNYNVLLATPLEEEAIMDLEFKESLEDQFNGNSNN